MTTITDDKWDQKVWGAATAEGTNKLDTVNSNLIFYWGNKVIPIYVHPTESVLTSCQDKWVAKHTRDALIKARGHLSSNQSDSGSGTWKPVMRLDDEGMPHDFCTTLRNSHSVAGKVKDWVDGIIEAHSTEIT